MSSTAQRRKREADPAEERTPPDEGTESSERILRSALTLFARRGYAGTSVRRIAQDAGVAQGLLYTYFDGKAGLLKAIFEACLADVRSSFDEAAAASSTDRPGEALGTLVHAAFRIVLEQKDFWRLSYQLRTQEEVMDAVGEGLSLWTSEILARLERLLRARGCGNPSIEARVLFACIDGAAQHLVMDPTGYPTRSVADEIVLRFASFNSGAES